MDPSDIRQQPAASSARQTTIHIPKILIVGVVFILCIGGAFYGGILYQEHHGKSTDSANRLGGFGGRFGGAFGGQRPTIGQVTAVSASSITVQNSQSGSSSTFSITSSTSITDNGQSASLSSIEDGDTVLIVTSSSNSSTASRILINPSFGGGNGGE